MARIAPAGPGLLLLVAVLLQCSPLLLAQEWKQGRAGYYGAPFKFSQQFDAWRGKNSFGSIAYGSCGFTNSNGYLTFPRDAVAAFADGNKDYPGSCGRCYALRCKEGLVLDNDGAPMNISSVFYFPWANRGIQDTAGRGFPGNPNEGNWQLYTKCWDPSKQITVRIIDSCNCVKVLPDPAKGETVMREHQCCSGSAQLGHFELSYWAFEQLAHPLYPRMMLEYRPVDCDTGAAISQFVPGYISRTEIYQNGTKAGWSWLDYFSKYKKYSAPAAGTPDDSTATCVELLKNGGISFQMKQGYMPGYQPFRDTQTISVLLKSVAKNSDFGKTSTPKYQVPNLKVFLQNTGSQMFCYGELRTANYAYEVKVPPGKGDSWWQVNMPMKDFKCEKDGMLPHQIDRIDFQNTGDLNAMFCLASLKLIKNS